MGLRMILFLGLCALCIANEEKKLLNKFCPFTMEQCMTEPYNKLKSCKLAVEEPEKLIALTQDFLCASRDTIDGQASVIDKRSLESGNHTRRKRSTNCNLCMRYVTTQIIYAAQDAQYGTDEYYELLHNPAENLYQTYAVQTCDTSVQTMVQGRRFVCGKEMIEFVAAVFTNDNSVRSQRVRYPTTCALIDYGC